MGKKKLKKMKGTFEYIILNKCNGKSKIEITTKNEDQH